MENLNNPQNTQQNQPTVNVSQQKPPKSWLLESILVTLFCCLPFGIIGIIYATKVETLFYAGDIEGAKRASENAKTWTLLGFFIGLVVAVVYLLLIIIGAASGV